MLVMLLDLFRNHAKLIRFYTCQGIAFFDWICIYFHTIKSELGALFEGNDHNGLFKGRKKEKVFWPVLCYPSHFFQLRSFDAFLLKLYSFLDVFLPSSAWANFNISVIAYCGVWFITYSLGVLYCCISCKNLKLLARHTVLERSCFLIRATGSQRPIYIGGGIFKASYGQLFTNSVWRKQRLYQIIQ